MTGKKCCEHLQSLEEVLKKLEASEVRLKREKCVFLAEEVTHLGHRINKHGRKPTEYKVQVNFVLILTDDTYLVHMKDVFYGEVVRCIQNQEKRNY